MERMHRSPALSFSGTSIKSPVHLVRKQSLIFDALFAPRPPPSLPYVWYMVHTTYLRSTGRHLTYVPVDMLASPACTTPAPPSTHKRQRRRRRPRRARNDIGPAGHYFVASRGRRAFTYDPTDDPPAGRLVGSPDGWRRRRRRRKREGGGGGKCHIPSMSEGVYTGMTVERLPQRAAGEGRSGGDSFESRRRRR